MANQNSISRSVLKGRCLILTFWRDCWPRSIHHPSFYALQCDWWNWWLAQWLTKWSTQPLWHWLIDRRVDLPISWFLEVTKWLIRWTPSGSATVYQTHHMPKPACVFFNTWPLASDILSAGSDKNHAGDSTWWSTNLVDFDITGRLWWKNKKKYFYFVLSSFW